MGGNKALPEPELVDPLSSSSGVYNCESDIVRPESRLSDILSFLGGGHGSSNSLSRLSMDESSRLSPPAVQQCNMLL